MKRINITKLNITLWGIIVIVVIVLAFRLCKATEGNNIKIGADDKIDVTPTIITSMKEIGEWEFLSIDDEELVDTTRKGFLRDDKLVRIYYGKLSLGLNMHKTGPKWVEKRGDSTIVTLPPIELLDNNFIDEARTKAFIETGDWTDADRENMYHTAYNKMLRRCMTKENIQTAQTNAEQQFGKMLKALGVEKYTIRWNTEK
ncbi:MAG TPA: DUF4230 domain-containing protein [Prevotella sp.]|nr:DUF4230 domain-containing protein [Prevotella sp.]